MATEETSVIAALSGAGKWVNEHKGKIQTSQQGKGIRGQLYFREKVTLVLLLHTLTSTKTL